MAIPADSTPHSDAASIGRRVKRAAITGTALTIPLVLTLVVLQLALGMVAQVVAPLVAALQLVGGVEGAPALLLEVLTVLTLVAVILVVGFAAEYRSAETGLSREFDALMARIPGLGSVYTGVRRLSEVVLEQDTESFQAVRLVEFPRDGSFMLGFVTAEPPEAVTEVAGAESMATLFVPLAPNPVMGGFLVHVPEERVHEVDLSVEEGVQSIVTSGAAIDPRVEASDAESLSLSDVELFDGDLLDADIDASFARAEEE